MAASLMLRMMADAALTTKVTGIASQFKNTQLPKVRASLTDTSV